MGYGTDMIQKLIHGLEEKKQPVHQSILAWSQDHPSRYVWRQPGSDAYHALIGETLLEKLEKDPEKAYQGFIKRFPALDDVKKASAEQITETIAALGPVQYREPLQKLIDEVAAKGAGGLPRDSDTIARITGLEKQQIKAVFCFGYGLPVAVINEHVSRMLTRLFAYSLPAHPAEGLIRALADGLLCYEDSLKYNGALLDIAELICRTDNPLCTGCPVKSVCDYVLHVPGMKLSYAEA